MLLLFSSDIPHIKELLPIFNSSVQDKTIHLITKFHPATTRLTINNWMATMPDNLKKQIHPVHGEESPYNLMAMSDLCVLSEGSTTGLEALCIGKPLVLLDLQAPVIYQSNLVEENAAIGMTPPELGRALAGRADFEQMMNKKGVDQYISNEIFKTKGSIAYAADLMKVAVAANHATDPDALVSTRNKEDMEWSVILPVTDDPALFLKLLENIAAHSENHRFEVILIRAENVSKEIDTILNSLEGDISFVVSASDSGHTLPDLMNTAATQARGRHLVFLEQSLYPKEKWLDNLEKEIKARPPETVFGAHVINTFNNIVHAGIVLNANNQPVSAYQHLDDNFPHACKTRHFQMVDHFIAVRKHFFLDSGGFDSRSGHYLFLDFCLRVNTSDAHQKSVLFCSDVRLVKCLPERYVGDVKDTIFFHSKWHGRLWENEAELLKKDGVSALQLDAARMTRALETSGLK